MFCRNCGKEIDDQAAVCVHCGVLVQDVNQQNVRNSADYNQSKTGMGVLFALILGLIGLLIGIVIYPTGTEARKTFIKGWGITFAISFAISFIFFLIFIILIAVTW